MIKRDPMLQHPGEAIRRPRIHGDGYLVVEPGDGTPPEAELADKHHLTRDLQAELKRAGLATWGGVGSVESVAEALWRLGWRKP